MELMMIVKAVLALGFVLGLLLLTLWALKYCQQYMTKNKWSAKLKAKDRIVVEESKKIDARNSLVLVKVDGDEHLLLIGQGQSMVVANLKGKK